MSTPPIGRRRRSFKILRLFFGLVFSFLLQYFRARLVGRSYDFFEDADRNRRRAARIRNTALEMGGVLIKVGQFLSSRVDLLPSEYIEELALLQDEVPGVAFAEIREVLEHELGDTIEKLFRELDPIPVAAASLGQVHRAVLPTGEVVAVKVQRPNIETIVQADLASLHYIVHWLNRYTPIGRRTDMPKVMDEFEETLNLELDYRAEGHHAERIAIMFRDTPEILVPRIYWSHSSHRVLTLQYVDGIKVTDFETLDRNHIDRTLVAEILLKAYFRQVLVDGFFHADPHPGNILVRPGPVVVLLDFGMVGEISVHTREHIRQVFLGIIRRDYDSVITSLGRLGFFTPDADRKVLRRALIWTINTFYDLSFGQLRLIRPEQVMDHLQDVLFSESFRIPANYAFLGRALGTLSGLCTALDPSFQFFTVAEPYARSLVQEGTGVRQAALLVYRETRSLASHAYMLPFLTTRILQDVASGEISFEHQFVEVVDAVDRLERAMRRLVHGLLLLGLIISGALLIRAHASGTISIPLILAILFFVVMVFRPRRRRR